MDFGLRDFFNNFADNNEEAREKSRLTYQMTQAFWRREHGTIDMLAQKGAGFTPEMLLTAVGYRDLPLTEKCLNAGVLPEDAHFKAAIDLRDHDILNALTEKKSFSEDIQKYIQAHGDEKMRHISVRKEKREDVLLTLNPAFLSTP
jgi:hypothetical protein